MKIRIKKKNRGKFTALKKRTGHSATWFKQHGTPAQKKMATFELNARKWKHGEGGSLNLAPYAYGGPIVPNNYLPSFIGKREPLPTVRYDEGGDLATLNNPNYNAAKEEAMYNYLINKGLNAAQASGLLGNLAVESYLNADMQQKGGSAYGLMQAEAGRQRAMRKYNDVPYEFGSNLTQEEQQQLDYIIEKGINSYTPGEWGKSGFKGARNARQAFLDTNDVNQASDIITFNYLRPGKPHQDRRRKMSQYYYNKYNAAPLFAPLFTR